MANQGARGFKRLILAAGYSWSGFKAAIRHEEAFRQELALFVILFPTALWFGENGVERALLVGSLLVVLITELLNTAVEVAVDRFGPEHHKLSGRAKDIASAAVFVSLLLVTSVWLLILL